MIHETKRMVENDFMNIFFRLCMWFSILLWLFRVDGVFGAADSVSDLKKRSAKLAANVMQVKSLEEAAKICEQIFKRKPYDFETMTLFSRVCWALGKHQKEESQQQEWFAQGREVGKKIREIYPEKPEGYYWFGINYGEWVDRGSIFAKIGAKKIILENMEKVLVLDDKYDGGGAYIVIGRINYVAPGGSYSKAIQYYKQAMMLGPERTTAYLYLGELYLHEHLFDKAEELFKKVISMEVDPCYAIEARDDRKNAERLLKKVEKKGGHFPRQEKLTGH